MFGTDAESMVVKSIDGHCIATTGRLVKIAAVRDEPYECLGDPEDFVGRLKGEGFQADLFTFLQEISEPTPKYPFYQEWYSLAVVPVTSYENWWKNQVNGKTRNMIRKAQKSGLEFRIVEFDDHFVRGVMEIYNESPIRQGNPFKHYGKEFETIKRELSTFFTTSDFVGAYCKGKLIGFFKLVTGKNVASLMHIISRIAHRDKAPTNGLIAKAVELCAEREIAYLHYGIWSRRGLGDFKKHHGFVCHNVPRFYVPLNSKGELMLKLNLHRKFVELIPKTLVDDLVLLRARLNLFRYSRPKTLKGQ